VPADTAVAVPVPGPVDLAGSLDVLRRAGDDLLDRWDGHLWLRGVAAGGRLVGTAARPMGTAADPVLLVSAEDGADPAAAGQTLAGAFLTAPEALADLAAVDPVVARIATRFPGVGPVLQPDLLTAVVRAISAQQITLRFAATLRGRLARRYGHRHELPPPPAGPGDPGPGPVPGRAEVWGLDARRLAGAEIADLRALQFSTSKAVAVTTFAAAVADGRVDLRALAGLDDEEVIDRLVRFPGIGRWTAEWLLARTMGRPRVVAGDLGVRKAVGAAYLDGRMPSEAEVRTVTAHWGAAGGVAQQLLLHWLSAEAPGRGGPRRPQRAPRADAVPTRKRAATRPGPSSPRG
jgi:3-methyladenine DNA glycosylase/8-oxoguanine DNA glycosylase